MYEIYTVNTSDTIDSIANKYGIDKELLFEINGFPNNYILTPNTQIIVPTNKNNTFQYYTVKKWFSIYQIAKQYNIDYDLLLKLNGLDKDDYIYPNQTLLLPRSGLTVYLTKQGDTLNEIIENLDTDINKLLSQNKNIYLQPEQIIVFESQNQNWQYNQFFFILF